MEAPPATLGELVAERAGVLGAMIADTITEREGIDDALDKVFADETFNGTYLDAIRAALADRRVKHRHTGAEGMLLNERGRPIAIVHWDAESVAPVRD
ncbi:hypothetical protein RA997_23150, partial [Mycobacteroides abscessus subsp. abscessus]